MSEWKQVRLGDVVEVKYGKDHKKLKSGNVPVYGSGGVMRCVDTSIYDEESVLIPRKGTLNNIFYMDKPFWTVDTIFWTRINKSKIVPKFLYYQLKLIDFVSLNVGTAVPSMTVKILNELGINLPPLPTQQKIASILSSLDNKIENNRKTCEKLEEIAQAIFKRWFVDFEFPCLPDGAGKPTFSDGAGKPYDREDLLKVCTYKAVGGLPSPSDTKHFVYVLLCDDESFYIGIIKAKKHTIKPTRVCNKNDLVFCIRATIGNNTFADKQYCLGRGVAAITPHESLYAVT